MRQVQFSEPEQEQRPAPGRLRNRQADLDPLEAQEASDYSELELGNEQLASLETGEPLILESRDSAVALQRVGFVSTTDEGGIVALLASKKIGAFDRQIFTWFLISSIAVLGVAILAARLLSERIVRPLSKIQTATAAIADGDLSARTQIESNDEVGQLADSVNSMATELERSKALDQQFLMSVSHDLRTPLTAISGYAEAISDGAVSDYGAAGQVILNQSERLERLVRDLLDLARLDANRFQLNVRSFDLNVVVGRAIASVAPIALDSGIEIKQISEVVPSPNSSTQKLASGMPQVSEAPQRMVKADSDRVEQAVLNLVDNALKFARKQIIVNVGAVQGFEQVSVIDDGPGVDPADQPFLFDRLYTGSAQPVRGENSTGLGLAIVKELVQAMGGSVSVGNAAPNGAIISFTVPTE